MGDSLAYVVPVGARRGRSIQRTGVTETVIWVGAGNQTQVFCTFSRYSYLLSYRSRPFRHF